MTLERFNASQLSARSSSNLQLPKCSSPEIRDGLGRIT